MKTPSDDLFQLIKSLSPSEKGYFIKFTSRGSVKVNNYILLFNAIAKQEIYDEEKVRKKLHIKSRTGTQNFSKDKAYLHQIILESLNNYHKDNSVESRILKLLHQAEILYYKGLHSQSLALINKAKDLAISNEKFAELIPVLRLESYIYKNNQEKTHEIYQEQKMAHKKSHNLLEFIYINHRCIAKMNQQGPPRSSTDYNIEELFNSPLLENPDNALSFKANIGYYTAHGLHCHVKGDHPNLFKFHKMALTLYEDNPSKIAANQLGYLGALQNYLNSCILLNKWKEIFEGVRKTSHLSGTNKRETESRIFYISTYFPLTAFNAMGKFKEGLLLSQQIEKACLPTRQELKKHSFNIIYEFSFYIVLSCNYFGRGDFKKALAWQNKMLNHPQLNSYNEYYSFTRIFLLIIHYELQNEELVISALISVYRSLIKKQRLFKFEQAVIGFIRKMSKSNTPADLLNIFKKLSLELREISKDPFEKNAFLYFDFVSWVESKVQNRTLEEVIREKE